MGRCITAMRRWPREPKVETRSQLAWRHQMNVWSICASISVTITDVWTKFGIEHKYHTINTPEWPNSHKLKIQDGGGRHLEFRKSKPEVIRETSSNEPLEHKCVDLSDYRRYLNQILYRAQAPHYEHDGMYQMYTTWKSKMVAAAILNFGNMSITWTGYRYLHQILWEDAQRPCGYDHLTKSRNRKLIHETSSNEPLEHKCVNLSDYRRYLNQILYRAQAPHY